MCITVLEFFIQSGMFDLFSSDISESSPIGCSLTLFRHKNARDREAGCDLAIEMELKSEIPITPCSNSRKEQTMNRQTSAMIAGVVFCVVALFMLVPLAGQKVSAKNALQTGAQGNNDNDNDNDNDNGNDKDKDKNKPPKPKPKPTPVSGIYNPYPPGILPDDLNAEINRVLREIDVIENRAIQRWHSLQPPVLTNQPPILQNTGTESIETLGELMNYDKNIAPGKNQACASCHMPYVAFSGPIPSVNLTMVAYPGTEHFRAGKRTAQRYPYAPFFPVLQYNQEQGLFFGGNFWDSRATGYLLRNADAEQAQHPPVDTQEMRSEERRV